MRKRNNHTTCLIYDNCSSQHDPAFVVIVTRWKGNWVFTKRKDAEHFGLPGGRVRLNESPLISARRILYEQTGITAGKLYPICNYSLAVAQTFNARLPRKEFYGRLYYVEALCKTALPDFEIECTREDGWVPEDNGWAYPVLQKPLFRKACAWLEDARNNGAPETEAFFFEKVCGMVPYCMKDGIRHYLVIQNLSGHVGFPKGHTENNETELETALREAREEAGLSLTPVPNFRYSFSYRAQEHALRIHKYAVYFIGAFTEEQILQIHIQQEEILHWWLQPYEETLGMLNKQNDQKLLTRVEEFLAQRESE